MEIKTTRELYYKYKEMLDNGTCDEEAHRLYNEKWIAVEDLQKYINNARDNGNLIGEKGFSAALFLSDLIKKLEVITDNNKKE